MKYCERKAEKLSGNIKDLGEVRWWNMPLDLQGRSCAVETDSLAMGIELDFNPV